MFKFYCASKFSNVSKFSYMSRFSYVFKLPYVFKFFSACKFSRMFKCFIVNLRTVTHSLTDMPTSRDAVASKNNVG